jgi:hypothetical protein
MDGPMPRTDAASLATALESLRARGLHLRRGMDPEPMPVHLVQLADGMMSGYVASDQAVHTRATQLEELMGDRPVYGMVRAISPDANTPEETAWRVMAWRESGVDGIDVYNYGFMPLPMFDAIRQALQGTV